MLHQQSLLQTRLHHNVKNLWLKIRLKNEKENSLSSGPIAAFKKIPFAPMEAVAGSFIQIPPHRGSGKSGSCYWAGGWRVVKNKACQKMRSTKIRRLRGRNKKWIFDLFLHGNYIEDIFPMKKRKCNFSEVRARPK